MYYILAAAGSALIAVMVVLNGRLTEIFDVFAATTIIHIVGLLFISLVLAVKKERPWALRRRIVPALFSGGAIGVCTTLFNNAAFGKISVSAILALGLFAQILTSLVIDQFGLFHMPVRRFRLIQLPGILCTLIGILCLMYGTAFAFIPVVLSLMTGISVVTSRSVNAELSEITSPLISTWYNYVVGLIVCIILWAGAAFSGNAAFPEHFSVNPLYYMGGIVGVGTVLILNLTVKKMPAFLLTLIMFVGQIFTGILLDFLLETPLSVPQLAGGLLTAAGLILYLWLNQQPSSVSTD